MAAKVSGWQGSDLWSGSITANIENNTGGGLGPGGFGSASVGLLSVGCGIGYFSHLRYDGSVFDGSYNPDIGAGDPEFDAVKAKILAEFETWSAPFVDYNENHYPGWPETPIFYFMETAIYKAYVSAGMGESDFKYAITIFGGAYHYTDVEDLEGSEVSDYWGIVFSDGPVEAGYTLGFDGLELWRELHDNSPSNRPHQHPTDVTMHDALVIGQNFTATVSFYGMSASVPVEGYTEGETVYDNMISGWGIGYSLGYDESTNGTDEYGVVSVSGVDFSALNEAITGGFAIGSGGGFTLHATGDAGWSGSNGPGYYWGYSTEGLEYLEDEFNPLIIDSFLDSNGDPTSYALNSLPTSVVDPGNGQSWGDPTAQRSSYTFSPSIDRNWAMENGWLQEATLGSEDDPSTHNDLFLCVAVPGLDQDCTAYPWRPLVSYALDDAVALLPLVARANPADSPWSGAEGLSASGEAGQDWTIARGTSDGRVSADIRHRYWDRLDLILANNNYSFDWIFKLQAQLENVVDTIAEPTFKEDKFNWSNYSYFRIEFIKPEDFPDDLDWNLTLEVNYSELTVFDQHYTDSFRQDEWEYTRSDQTAYYTFELLAEDSVAIIDLLCPDDGSIPHLYIVNSVVLSGFTCPISVAEDIDLYLHTFSLIRDQGFDHTGRNNNTDSTATFKAVECWDFRADWLGFSGNIDGNLRVCERPDEPWLNKGPEKGIGYIQPLQHSPFNPIGGELHYARPLESVGIAEGEGLNFTILEDTLDAMLIDEVVAPYGPNTLCSPLMYWLSNQIDSTEFAGTPNSLFGGITVRSWGMAKGVHYTCHLRKIGGGAGHGLMKTSNGLARILPGDTYEGWVVVLFSKYSYFTALGVPIATPSGQPTPDIYTIEETGDIANFLDSHGVFRTPDLKPYKTLVAEDGDYKQTEYYGQIWQDNSYTNYDINEPSERLDMLEDIAFVSDFYLNPQTRRWSTIAVQGPTPIRQVSATEDYYGGLIICRNQEIVAPSENNNAMQLSTDNYCPFTNYPEYSNQNGLYYNPSVTALPYGELLVVAERRGAGGTIIQRQDAVGRKLQQMTPNAGFVCPSVVYDNNAGEIICSAIGLQDGIKRLWSLSRNTITNSYTWEELNEIGEADAIPGSLIVFPTGERVDFRVNNKDTIISLADDGTTLGTQADFICPSACINEYTNELFIAGLNLTTNTRQLFQLVWNKLTTQYDWVFEDDLGEMDIVTGSCVYWKEGYIKDVYVKNGGLTIANVQDR